MKRFPLLICLGLAGCQTAVPLPPPPRPAPAMRPVVVNPAKPAEDGPELKLRRQAQYIDALISQNEALVAKLAAPPATPAVAAVTVRPEPALSAPVNLAALEPAGEWLTPNADGVIDLTAVATDAAVGESVNPFAVRTSAAGGAREVTLRVSGIVAGKTPCAVINDRVVQANEMIEVLTVERIEAESVCLRYAGQRVRVPVSDQAVKVKLPL
jgi:hypothetical protein